MRFIICYQESVKSVSYTHLHKLEEIFEIADEITVMRDGQYIGTWDIKDITIDQLIGQMVGRKMNERFPLCEDARTCLLYTSSHMGQMERLIVLVFIVAALLFAGIWDRHHRR